MDYVAKVGDWILYSSDYGLKIGIVRYIKERQPSHRIMNSVTVYYTDTDQVTASEVLEIRT